MNALPPLRIETAFGQAIAPHVAALADLRIRGFRAFPYLYEGSLAYERAYLEGYAREPRAMLVRVLDDDLLAAAATALPLAANADMVVDAAALFAARGYDPGTFYYYAEILVEPGYRGRRIAETIYGERERWARHWGYRHLCLAVVERDANHPLRPQNYVPPERIWVRDGFVPTDMTFAYRWPTIQPDRSVIEQDNPMRFWMKTL